MSFNEKTKRLPGSITWKRQTIGACRDLEDIGSSQSPIEVTEGRISIESASQDACKNRGIRYRVSRIEQDIQERILIVAEFNEPNVS
ncbi:MAG: hypothetical protein F4Y63_06300 [Chloroflexi bacterium]|nr:hypothetical protein [Chloroflexota bacterium]MYK60461.1 hypothetical protein [Chloroflexota bacterium]